MWKVYGYMEGRDGNQRFPSRMPTIYGPLTRKRWVPVKGERYRKEYKGPKKAWQGNAPSSTKDYTASRADLYARWLAQRDGVTIPEDAKAFPVWSSVIVPGKDRPEPRVSAVEYCEARRNYAGGVTRDAVQVTIAIPHWDWVPTCTEETLELALAA